MKITKKYVDKIYVVLYNINVACSAYCNNEFE